MDHGAGGPKNPIAVAHFVSDNPMHALLASGFFASMNDVAQVESACSTLRASFVSVAFRYR